MDIDEDPDVLTQAVRTSSLTRGYHTLGVEMHNLDSDVEVKKQKSLKTKSPSRFVSESQWAVTPPNYDFMSLSAPPTPNGKILGALRRRGQPNMDFPKEKGAMEVDLSMGITSTSQDANQHMWSRANVPTSACSMFEPRKASASPSLLPSLTVPGNTADNIKWSVKMAHASKVSVNGVF